METKTMEQQAPPLETPTTMATMTTETVVKDEKSGITCECTCSENDYYTEEVEADKDSDNEDDSSSNGVGNIIGAAVAGLIGRALLG